jgi:hypothetical protein
MIFENLLNIVLTVFSILRVKKSKIRSHDLGTLRYNQNYRFFVEITTTLYNIFIILILSEYAMIIFATGQPLGFMGATTTQ